MIEHKIKATTCRISCGDMSGTGWLIGKNWVITARHCVIAGIESGKPVELFFPDSGGAAVTGKITAQSEHLDTCLLSLDVPSTADPIPVSLKPPCEGESWLTFGYPQSKLGLAHRLSGAVAQVLKTPQLKIDLDLSVDSTTALQNYRGMSGAAVVCEGIIVGMIRLKLDGAVAALSVKQLERFLIDNGVIIPNESTAHPTPSLADRENYPELFSEALQGRSGSYVFLEGAHGYGKSTFCQNFQSDDRQFVSLGAYCLSDPNSALGANYRAQPQVFLDWLTSAIAGRITGKQPRKKEKNYAEQILQTAEYLDEFSNYCAQSKRQGMFFIDGLNEISGGTTLEVLLGLLPAKLPLHISIVLTAPNFDNIAVSLAGKVNRSDVLNLPPLTDSACRRHCQRALKPERTSPVLVNRICERAKGHPLYLRYLIEYVNHQAIDDGLDDFPVLSGSIEDYYQGIWAKLLPDAYAVNLLALMARLRWGITRSDFAKILSPSELAQFVSVISRIRHLLADDEGTAIYHTSFAAFIIDKTAEIDELTYRRLAKFCGVEQGVGYCVLNRVYHLSRVNDKAVFTECNQAWFDAVVTLGVEPDALIADVDAVVKHAAKEAPVDEFFRLLLLAQRINFRYDTLFAQSARLIAESLIVFGRPNEALQHVVRLKTLIISPDDALEIAFLLHRHDYDDEALTLLKLIQQRFIENYDVPMTFDDHLKLCSWHIQAVFLVRLANGWNGMKQVIGIMKMAREACDRTLRSDKAARDRSLSWISARSPAYFLTFRDEYADLHRLREYQKAEGISEMGLPPGHLLTQCIALMDFEKKVDAYRLPKKRMALVRLFADLGELIQTSEIEHYLANAVTDTLIRFGAPAGVVEQFGAKGGKQPPRKIQVKAKNGVDVDHVALQECLCNWRVTAFLDNSFRGLSAGIVTGAGWLESIEHLIGALYCCDGRARRAKADSDEKARIACRDQLNAQVIEPLRLTLQQRAAWSDSYAIPETVLPAVYRELTELLDDCFPEEIPKWLDRLAADANGQWGMYSEGFRDSAYYILEQLTREEPSDERVPKLLGLLHQWRDHVLRGVENRHELVPEILRMIPIFACLGAKEDAERLYQQLLSVSMGPTWYKEDQLGIMTEVLGNITVSNEVGRRLPQIAGYLERASGEMTFQRYVRAEKTAFLGQIARHGRRHAALAYFCRQCCGTLTELWAEAQQGPIDKVGSLNGNRFPGGALDDQSAILTLVRNSETVSWTLRWALLEIFHCGDERHLTDFAKEFAKIANEVGPTAALIKRVEIVANAETSSEDQPSFASSFLSELKPESRALFAKALVVQPPIMAPEPPAPQASRKEDDDDAEDKLYNPGVFGRKKALRDAEEIVAVAEKQWSLGNRNAAKAQAIKALQIAQKGGWNIWGNLSSSTQRAMEILVNGETSAANVIRYYAPLIEDEHYVPKWVPVQRLIGNVGPLLNEIESQRLLDAVIDHFRMVVGDAPQEIQSYGFLSDEVAELSPDVEVFRFIVWLCNYPRWLRRDRAAAMLLWLAEQCSDLFPEIAATAFSMKEGNGPDVLCGVLDGASARQPAAVWEKIAGVLDPTMITKQLRHVSRMIVLERLANRAHEAGSSSAESALKQIRASFPDKRLVFGNPTMPIWANFLAREWDQLSEFVDVNTVNEWSKELDRLCSPLSVNDAMALENSVSTSFRENSHRPFNRWSSMLRHSLNIALWTRLTYEDALAIEAILRTYNPSQPERMVLGMSNPLTDQLIAAIKSDDYSSILCSNANVILNFHDIAVKPTKDGASHIEVLCLLQPTFNQRGIIGTQLDESFRSSELPMTSKTISPFETCCRLDPEVVFFGPFTPATPLPHFQSVVAAKDDDFIRQNWRYGRRNEDRGFGQPERCGCSLSIPRKALKIPSGSKLTWIVWLDNRVVTVVDEQKNRLV